ncbi:alpha-galactosidase [Paenibacillus macquariensis]|uniref:Alpha-galactosidase n=1 Tax=Paenibacillus macquariensis TaxID=948756 RepID=A0ABY1JR68_9BACL|nr:alpha-galactosidase [Paenibacillus macquariensis]MEC0092700.1 alpha-galactosidase [Paenibacillus macquariensis]OAB36633.1 alpha-galactosidase [Paenibacillus macquariensis subsp. macquariensis]SIQ64177.1 alpha-galactosidase [Paenibacillus macquariensis]
MGIVYDDNKRIFHLKSRTTSYIFQADHRGYLIHLYWGRPISDGDLTQFLPIIERPFSPMTDANEPYFSLDVVAQEYPGYGTSDYRQPAYQMSFKDGSTAAELLYQSHRTFAGKSRLEGLPATYVESDDEATTLEITLLDPISQMEVCLSYTVYESLGAIIRSVRYVNRGEQKVQLLRTLSASVDFHHQSLEWIQLSGAWAKERWLHRNSLAPGIQSVESRRGSSSHQHNPFIALVESSTTEDRGDAYGFSFVYSGNFLASVEVDQHQTTRVSMGINPFDFKWLLEPGESFQTPEVVMVYSNEGLGGMSRQYHKLYRTRLARGQYRDQVRPILVNNWEATYFDFNEEKIVSLADEAKDMGIELFVLDDGWFGKRDNDRTSLGDWFENRSKLPNGLAGLAKELNDRDLKFGLWLEPEMVSVESELYQAHPDWCLHIPNRRRTEGRFQLILDLSRQEVCDALIEKLSGVLSSAPISYVKWDMNRNMTEIGSAGLPPERQRETAHRYMLGLYHVLETITERFPHILFESCSGGGGRFDPGMLHYMPQTWTSDNSDAIERLKIQYGTSLVYPVSSMGAHVTAVPNHQVHRHTPLSTRGDVALSGNFGYELDLTKMTEAEKMLVQQQIKQCKDVRHLTFNGDFYRLSSPFEGNETAWMFVSEDQDEALVFWIKVLAEPAEPLRRLKLRGLDLATVYVEQATGMTLHGDTLMHAGVQIPVTLGDFQSVSWHFKRVTKA